MTRSGTADDRDSGVSAFIRPNYLRCASAELFSVIILFYLVKFMGHLSFKIF